MLKDVGMTVPKTRETRAATRACNNNINMRGQQQGHATIILACVTRN